jgi:hypothetical protein
MATSSGKWKSALLSSGVPLEHEAARVLVEKKCAVQGEYRYSRPDSGELKDFSIDLAATYYYNRPRSDLLAPLELLVECKYRHRNTKWLFIPDPNKDFGPIGAGYPIRYVDAFSRIHTKKVAIWEFTNRLPVCIKGIEANEETGIVTDSELRHAIAQLQYALPSLVNKGIEFNSGEYTPFGFAPIILTTAELFVARRNFSIQKLERAEHLSDLAVPVPYLLVHADCGPGLEAQIARVCSGLADLASEQFIKNLTTSRAAEGSYQFQLPDAICSGLARAERQYAVEYFTAFLVANWKGFPSLLDEVKSVFVSTCRTARAKSYNAPLRKRR